MKDNIVIVVRWIVVFFAVAIALTACGAGQIAANTPVPILARLPTVTPIPTADPAATAAAFSAITLPTAAATATAATTTTPTLPLLTETENGFVTPAMAQLQLDGEQFATLGDPAAPITIVEFSDYGCPFCRIFALRTFPTIKTDYIDTGKVYYVHKDLPIVSAQGALAAQAAECAGEQGAYWPMHDALFRTTDWNESADAARVTFQTIADELGLDAAALACCITEERTVPTIDRNFAEATALRLGGTPAFFINNSLLLGAQSPEAFKDILDERLGE